MSLALDPQTLLERAEAIHAEMPPDGRGNVERTHEAVERARADMNGAPSKSIGGRLRASAIDLLAYEPQPITPEPGLPHVPQRAFINIAAPAKSGKSIITLGGATEAALAGRRWAILDRENGADEAARREQDIVEARRLTAEQRATVSRNLAYHAWPQVPFDDDADAFDYLGEFDGAVFDSSLRFQSALAGREQENESADYAALVNALIDPLRAAGKTVVVLDNMGHEERGRARGTSAKRDLCDVALTLEQVVPFNDETCGRVRISVDVSRFGSHVGPWQVQIGGGHYGSIRPLEERSEAREQFRHAAIAALREAEGPLGQERVFEAVRSRGVKGRTTALRNHLAELAGEPGSGIASTAGGYVLAGEQPLVPIRDEGGTRDADPPSPAGGSKTPADEGSSRIPDAPGLGQSEGATPEKAA